MESGISKEYFVSFSSDLLEYINIHLKDKDYSQQLKK